MDAQVVWRTWRRVLRERPLQDAMFNEGFATSVVAAGLDPAERAVVQEYARSEAGTRFFIANYRFRMRSSFVNALETAAPLTHRLLRFHGVELDALGIEFLDSIDWLDHGPYVYTMGGAILAHLRERPRLATIPGLSALLDLESAGVRVVTGAASGGDAPPVPAGTVRASDRVEVVHTSLDVSGWLREPATLGLSAPGAQPRWFVVQLRSVEEERRIVAVPHRAADMVTVLAGPHTRKELGCALTGLGHTADPDLDATLRDRLVRSGVLVEGPDR